MAYKKENVLYPECEKMEKVEVESQAIGQFLDSELFVKYYQYRDDIWTPGIEKVLAEYFKIDLNKVEAEKRAMLDAIRKNQK